MLLRLITYNIRYGGRGHERQLLDILQAAQADVILFQEVTASAPIAKFAALLNMQSFIAAGNSFSIALLSRWPIVQARGDRAFPPIRDTILEAAVEYQPGQRLYLIGVHPVAYPGTFFEYWRIWELNAALRRAALYQTENCLIAGDFNAIAPQDRVLTDSAPLLMQFLYRLQGGKIYRQAVQRMLAAGFTDSYRHLHPNQDGFTLPAPHPKVRLDYIFANPKLTPRLRRCDVLTEPEAVHLASDHYPLITEFDL